MASYRKAMGKQGFHQQNLYVHDDDVDYFKHLTDRMRAEKYIEILDSIEITDEVFVKPENITFCYELANRRQPIGPDYSVSMAMKNEGKYTEGKLGERITNWIERFDECYLAKGMFNSGDLTEAQQALAGARAYAAY